MNDFTPLSPAAPDATVGVLVGRFQVPALHKGHHDLIRSVCARHDKVLLFLGSTPGVLVTRRSPLDFLTRKLMVQADYPEVTVLPLPDQPVDTRWSKALDRAIADTVGDTASVVLYGSRDSFIPAYSGKYPTVQLADSKDLSGTQIRRSVSHKVRECEEFRRGVVYAAFNRHPVSFQTVDCIVRSRADVLVARKDSDPEGKWRFPGGFIHPGVDESLEAAARRELYEESCGLGVHHPHYIGSVCIDDWRYRNEEDRILTAVFEFMHAHGKPEAGDDVDEVRWVPLVELESALVPQHLPIYELYMAYLQGDED